MLCFVKTNNIIKTKREAGNASQKQSNKTAARDPNMRRTE